MNSILQQTMQSKRPVYRRTGVIGSSGIGKTTFASCWPSPYFIATEDGQAHIDVPMQLCASYEHVEAILNAFAPGGEEHEYKTLVIDSLDWLESLVHAVVLREHNANTGDQCQSVSELPYGHGWSNTATKFHDLFRKLDEIRSRGMHVVLIAHGENVKIEEAGRPAYDKFCPKMHRFIRAMFVEWVDEMLCLLRDNEVTEIVDGMKRRGIGVTGQRTIFTEDTTRHMAKSRLPLPPQMPLDWNLYRQYLRGELKYVTT